MASQTDRVGVSLQAMSSQTNIGKSQGSSRFLGGQLLIAMPTMSDPRFVRSVIYMCAHTREGAMGIMINRRAPHIDFPDLLEQLDLAPEGENITLPPHLENAIVHLGGPVEAGRGFVLHSPDYFQAESTLPIDDKVCLTTTLDILRAIAMGKGPNKILLALGYAGWAPDQLESEIMANGWLHCPADEEIIFDTDIDKKYERALAKLGIDPSHLVTDSGHA